MEFKLGWLGLCTHKTRQMCVNIPKKIEIEPIDDCAQRLLDGLKEKEGTNKLSCISLPDVDFSILMTHQDVADDRHTISNTNCDLLLGGHDHDVFVEKVRHSRTLPDLQIPNSEKKDTWLVKVGKNATICGIVTIEVNEDGVRNLFGFELTARV